MGNDDRDRDDYYNIPATPLLYVLYYYYILYTLTYHTRRREGQRGDGEDCVSKDDGEKKKKKKVRPYTLRWTSSRTPAINYTVRVRVCVYDAQRD